MIQCGKCTHRMIRGSREASLIYFVRDVHTEASNLVSSAVTSAQMPVYALFCLDNALSVYPIGNNSLMRHQLELLQTVWGMDAGIPPFWSGGRTAAVVDQQGRNIC